MFDKEKIKYFKKSFFYLAKYKGLSVSIVGLSLASILFEGFSMGTIVPIFQILVDSTGGLFKNFVFLRYIQNFTSGISIEMLFTALLGFLLGAILLKNLFLYWANVNINKISNYIKRDLQVNLFNNLSGASLDFFVKAKSGHIISSIVTYTISVANFIYVFLSIFIFICRLVVYVLLLLFISWKFTVVAAAAGIILAPFIFIFLVKIRRISIKIADNTTSLYSYISETFYQIPLIKMFSTEDVEKRRFLDKADTLIKSEIGLAKNKFLLGPLAEMLVMTLFCGVFIVFTLFFSVDLKMFVPLLVAYLLVFFKFFSQTQTLINYVSEMFERLEQFRICEDLLNNSKKAILPNGKIKIDKLNKGFEFKNVSFGYNKDHDILKKINLFIPKGNFVALVGPTGAGKTTVANLLAGLYFPSEGALCIDDAESKDVDMQDWRQKIGYISQDIFLFRDTIKNNILYGKSDATAGEMTSAAKIAQIHDFIMTLPQGYDSVLGERGLNLSGGQRQRLSIARAIIRKPEVLILDEATSSLDNETEQLIQGALFQVFKGCTIIAIAHRLSTISKADKIFVLQDGEIVENGTHEDLAKRNGLYSFLYKLQMRN